MKTLKYKTEITSENLKAQDCNYNGKKLGYDKDEDVFTVSSLVSKNVKYFETIEFLVKCS